MISSAKPAVGGWEKTKLFFQQVKIETAKIAWPSKENLKTYTIVVIVSSALVGLLVGGWDVVLGKVIQLFFELNG